MTLNARQVCNVVDRDSKLPYYQRQLTVSESIFVVKANELCGLV